MRRVILDLFNAGTETSSTTLDWLLLYMVAYPEVQARCQQVIDKVGIPLHPTQRSCLACSSLAQRSTNGLTDPT